MSCGEPSRGCSYSGSRRLECLNGPLEVPCAMDQPRVERITPTHQHRLLACRYAAPARAGSLLHCKPRARSLMTRRGRSRSTGRFVRLQSLAVVTNRHEGEMMRIRMDEVP